MDTMEKEIQELRREIALGEIALRKELLDRYIIENLKNVVNKVK